MDKTFNICSYNIVSITPHDEQIVIQFLKNFFFRHEPLVLSLDIIKEVKSLEKLQNYAFKTLDNGLTFKAISSNGDLLGVILNDIIHRDDTLLDNCNEENQENSIKFKQFMALFQKIKQESDVFGKYPKINRIMDIKIVAVDETFRGKGVCKALFEKSKELALENECSMVCVDCSSYFSASAAEKLGFQCIYSLRYQEYKNEKGEVIFNSSPPHEEFKVYILPIKKY